MMKTDPPRRDKDTSSGIRGRPLTVGGPCIKDCITRVFVPQPALSESPLSTRIDLVFGRSKMEARPLAKNLSTPKPRTVNA